MDDLVAEFTRLLQASGSGIGGGIELLLSQLEPERARQLKLCAIPHQFDFRVLRAMEPELSVEDSQSACLEFSELSVVIPLAGEMALHDEARKYLFHQWLEDANAGPFVVANNALVRFYAPGSAESPLAAELSERNRMFHLIGADQAEGFQEFERIFRKMRHQFRLDDCRVTLDLVHEYDRVLTAEHIARVTYHQAKLAADLRDWPEAERLLQALIADAKLDPALRVKVYNRIGYVKHQQRSWTEAAAAYVEARRLANTLPQRGTLLPLIEHNLGLAYREQGSVAEAETLFRESIDSATALGDFSIVATAYNSLGTLQRRIGDLRTAVESYEKSLDALGRLDDVFRPAQVYNNLGMTYADLTDWPRSEDYLRRSLELNTKAGDTLGRATALTNLSRVHRSQNKRAEAIQELQEAAALFTQLKDWHGAAVAQRSLAALHRGSKDKDSARNAFAAALALFHQSGDTAEARNTQEEIDRLERKRGMPWWAWILVILGGLIIVLILIGIGLTVKP